MKPKKILIIAGEASGDLHAEHLVKTILQRDPTIKFYGMGGDKMRQAGVDVIVDYKRLALVGVTEIILHLHVIYAAFQQLKKSLTTEKPDLVILIDYPGFNLRFSKVAKRAGCKVFYYISPQVWAWRQGRVKTIQKNVDLMAVIFPFEVDFYKKFNIQAKYVGNPLTHSVKTLLSSEAAKQIFNIKIHSPQQPVIGLLPGSRQSEIKRLLPLMMEAAVLLQKKFPEAQFILPLAPSLTPVDIEPYLKNFNLHIKIILNRTYDVISICDAVIVTSGTATLETGLLGVPMVIIYKLSWLSERIARFLTKFPFLGICNIIAQKAIVKELIQNDATAPAIAEEITRILTDDNYRETIKNELLKVKKQLSGGYEEDCAKLVLEVLSQ